MQKSKIKNQKSDGAQGEQNLMEKIVSLAKRRGFIFPGSEIYGGLAGTWDFGPLGVALKNNIKRDWWNRFVERRDDMYGIESAILMNPKVWEASGHVQSFIDPMIDCKQCKRRFRADKIDPSQGCPSCGAHAFTEARPFNMMLKTFVGPVEDTASQTYLRPETAQGMFTNFKNVVSSMHPKLPFGIAQIGKAFRNEITPSNFIFRVREFEQMEVEYFVKPDEWEQKFEEWVNEVQAWANAIGLPKLHLREVPPKERAHYSERTVDFDFDFPFGREELYGLAYRADFDLRNHFPDLVWVDEELSKKIVSHESQMYIPHVIEPTFGVERTVLALLVGHYAEDGDRVLLRLPPRLAPVKIAVFPLLANKPELVKGARRVHKNLRRFLSSEAVMAFSEDDREGAESPDQYVVSGSRGSTVATVAWDDRGNIGKRYYSQDEIGTPWCVTVDFQSLEDNTVTVRDRDTAQQTRIDIDNLVGYFSERLR